MNLHLVFGLMMTNVSLQVKVKQSHHRGPEGSRMAVGRQPYAPATFALRKYSWYSFLLDAESTPGP